MFCLERRKPSFQEAINRVTIIRNCVSLLGNSSTYCFENCVQTFTNFLTMARHISCTLHYDEIPVSDSNIDLNEYSSTKWISSYTLKTLVLFEWSKNPEDEQWTGSNLTQRLVNILHNLLSALKKNKGIRSFWYKDYNVLPGEAEAFLSGAINRVTIIRNCVSLLGNASTYSFENCVQTFTNILTMARQKRKLADFLHTALRKIFLG